MTEAEKTAIRSLSDIERLTQIIIKYHERSISMEDIKHINSIANSALSSIKRSLGVEEPKEKDE